MQIIKGEIFRSSTVNLEQFRNILTAIFSAHCSTNPGPTPTHQTTHQVHVRVPLLGARVCGFGFWI
jgi:hypothetical protein